MKWLILSFWIMNRQRPFDENSFLGHFIFGITEARVQYVIKKEAVLLDNFQVKVDDKYADLKERSWEISQELV
jgi:hypothetical protein